MDGNITPDHVGRLGVLRGGGVAFIASIEESVPDTFGFRNDYCVTGYIPGVAERLCWTLSGAFDVEPHPMDLMLVPTE